MMLASLVAVDGLTRPLRRAPAPPLTAEREKTWSNPLGTSLTEVADGVWLAERPFYPTLPGLQGTDVGCKACVVKLPDGKLWVHAPVGLDEPLRAALKELGPVGHIVTPNTEHQKYAPMWIIEYPDAVSWACPGLREKKPDVGWQRSLQELLDTAIGVDGFSVEVGAGGGLTSSSPPDEWGGAIELCWVRDKIPLTGVVQGGIPFFNEVVFCHKPSGTLIVTDLWWNYPASRDDIEGKGVDVPLSSRLWKGGMDLIYRPVYNRLMRTPSCAASYETILHKWEWGYIAPCHGEPVAHDAKRVLREHLRL